MLADETANEDSSMLSVTKLKQDEDKRYERFSRVSRTHRHTSPHTHSAEPEVTAAHVLCVRCYVVPCGSGRC